MRDFRFVTSLTPFMTLEDVKKGIEQAAPPDSCYAGLVRLPRPRSNGIRDDTTVGPCEMQSSAGCAVCIVAPRRCPQQYGSSGQVVKINMPGEQQHLAAMNSSPRRVAPANQLPAMVPR